MEYLTKTIVLPVSGLEAIIREADGNAERLLFSKRERIHKTLPHYWAYLTRKLGHKDNPTVSDILDILEPDQVFLAIAIYRLTYGDTLVLQGSCPHCNKIAGYEVDLGSLDLLPPPEGATGPDPTFDVVLPRSGKTVTFGYVTGHQMLVDLDRDDFDPNRTDLAAIRAIDGSPEVKMREVSSWPGRDHLALRDAVSRIRCGYDTRVRFVHDACGKRTEMNLLTDPSFVLPGLPRPADLGV